MTLRYALPEQAAAEREFLPATAWWRFGAKFNVSPGQYVPAVRMHEQRSEGVMLRWGLIPSWFEGEITGTPKAHVRSIRVNHSKIYRGAWEAGRRCILPVTGFYTWCLTPEKYRQPFFAHLNRRSVFGLAALWDRWVSEEDDVIEGCSVLTVPANELLRGLTDEQGGMPAILRRKDYSTWLTASAAEAYGVLQPYQSGWMEAYPVSPRVNSTATDDPGLIRFAG